MCRIKKCAWSIISHEARLVASTTRISFKWRHNVVHAVAEVVVWTHEVSLGSGAASTSSGDVPRVPPYWQRWPRGLSMFQFSWVYPELCYCMWFQCWVFMRCQINVVPSHGHYSVSGIFLKTVLPVLSDFDWYLLQQLLESSQPLALIPFIGGCLSHHSFSAGILCSLFIWWSSLKQFVWCASWRGWRDDYVALIAIGIMCIPDIKFPMSKV